MVIVVQVQDDGAAAEAVLVVEVQVESAATAMMPRIEFALLERSKTWLQIKSKWFTSAQKTVISNNIKTFESFLAHESQPEPIESLKFKHIFLFLPHY